jgi:hypothetical protein
LCHHNPRADRKRGSARCQLQKPPACNIHDILQSICKSDYQRVARVTSGFSPPLAGASAGPCVESGPLRSIVIWKMIALADRLMVTVRWGQCL